MYLKKLKGFSVMLVFAAVILLFSCTKGKSTDIDFMTKKAEEYLNRHPDSTLIYTQKVLATPDPKGISDPERLELYGLRQKAFAATENMDSVVAVGKKIRILAAEISDSLAIANSLLPVRGDIDFSSQQEMIEYLPGAIATFKKNNMAFNEAKLSSSYGSILCKKGDFEKAQSYLFHAYRILDKMDSINAKINVCINIGNVFFETKDTRSALKYYRKANLNANKMGDSIKIASSLLNIGTFYSEKKTNLDSASYYFQKALRYIPKNSVDFLKIIIEYDIANLEFNKGNLNLAKQKYKTMLNNCNSKKLFEGEKRARIGLAGVYEKQRHFKEAIQEVNKAIHISDSLGMSYETLYFRPNLVSIYKQTGDYKAALIETELIKKMNDSLISLDKQKAVTELAVQYETEKKELENKNLIQTLALRQKIIISLIISVLVTIVLVFIYYQRSLFLKERNRAYDILMAKYRSKKIKKNFMDFGVVKKNDISSDTKLLKEQLNHFFETERPYLNSKLKLEDVVLQLNTSKKELTHLLKTEFGNNFNTYMNGFRVEEIKKMFIDPTYSNYKIESIAKQAGFGSKQSFYNAFETYTGVKPNYYRSKIIL